MTALMPGICPGEMGETQPPQSSTYPLFKNRCCCCYENGSNVTFRLRRKLSTKPLDITLAFPLMLKRLSCYR